ncbi:hypothetical protein I5907_15305 [Panacibacter sp. DH6]|uniref:Lipocalin-like domain-containing protein n=1 Tax=Panacibacter microcysteis TaxID=2793269 RepID=A0A931EBL2_9BACT|nr:hypothetical protein [Panacibacter microcysteis]MBG9377611.1 hypothetical protein [Panacibacter microcysteis]
MKKQKLVRYLAVSVLAGLAFGACKNPDPEPLPEKVQKLIQTDWKIVDITTPKKETPGGDSSLLSACMTDDMTLFGANGVFELRDGTVKCDSTVFNYSNGYWGYKTDVDSIQLAIVNPASRYVSWKVLTLNDSVLKVTFIDSTVAANKITKTISFKK